MPRKNNKGRKPINYKRVNTLRILTKSNNNFHSTKNESEKSFKKATEKNRE